MQKLEKKMTGSCLIIAKTVYGGNVIVFAPTKFFGVDLLASTYTLFILINAWGGGEGGNWNIT